MKKTIVKWVLLIVALAGLASVTVWAKAQDSLRRCSGVEVVNSDKNSQIPLNPNGITDELAAILPNLTKMPVDSINTKALEKHFREMDFFEEVECLLTTKGKLRIVVKPMVPELRVFEPGKSYYINKDGKRIAAMPEFFSDVPIISGHFSEKFPAKTLLPVTRFISADPVLREMVTMVKADDAHNIILSTIFRGHVVNIGDTTRLKQKFDYLRLAYERILPSRGWSTYDTISVKFRGQIVATRAMKSTPVHAAPIEEETDLEEAALQMTNLSGTAEDNDN